MAHGRFMQSGSACIMTEFRSDHACIMHKTETDWMHARGQPASARAWPAASWRLPGCQMLVRMFLGRSKPRWRARMHGERFRFTFPAPARFRST